MSDLRWYRGRDTDAYIATIDPMHGVLVQADAGRAWVRNPQSCVAHMNGVTWDELGSEDVPQEVVQLAIEAVEADQDDDQGSEEANED